MNKICILRAVSSFILFSSVFGLRMAAEESKAAPSLYSYSEVTTKPEELKRVPPQYPSELRKQKVQGEAVVGFVIGKDGKVINVEVKRCTHPAFGKAAAEAVSQWVFSPALVDGKPVNVELQVPIVFALRDK